MTRQSMSAAEILALSPAHFLPETGKALGVSEPVIREMNRSGELERLGIKVVKLGAQYRVITSSQWAFLGISLDGAADGAGSEPQPQVAPCQGRPITSALRSVPGDEAG